MREQGAASATVAGVTSGQANVVRAALKAGIKPTVIAKRFGIPLATIRQLLASARTSRGSLPV